MDADVRADAARGGGAVEGTPGFGTRPTASAEAAIEEDPPLLSTDVHAHCWRGKTRDTASATVETATKGTLRFTFAATLD